MKILVIGRSYPLVKTGMFGTFEYDQALSLHELKHDVRYFFLDTRPIYRLHQIGYRAYQNQISSSGVDLPIGHFPRPVYLFLKNKYFIQQIKKVLIEFQPDLIHIHYPSILLTEKIWNFIRSNFKTVVLTEHYSKVMRDMLPPKQRKMLANAYTQSDAVICVSDKLKTAVQGMCSAQNVFVVPNVVSNKINVTSSQFHSELRFVYVGNIGGLKQVDRLIEAFAIFHQHNQNSQLRIVGTGPKMAAIQKQVSQLGLKNDVQFYGNVPRETIGDILNCSDFFVTASKIETFCVPVVESWNCGLPAIIPDSIPLQEYISSANAIVYPEGNVQKLAEAMSKAVSLQQTYDKKQIAEYAKDHFGAESIGKQLLRIYQDAINQTH